MKKVILLALLTSGTGVLSSAVSISEKKTERPLVTAFVRVETGFKRDISSAD